MAQWEVHNYSIVLPKKSSLKVFKRLDVTTVYRQYRVIKEYVSDMVVGRIKTLKDVHLPVMSPETYMA